MKAIQQLRDLERMEICQLVRVLRPALTVDAADHLEHRLAQILKNHRSSVAMTLRSYGDFVSEQAIQYLNEQL